jgi:DNA-binding response OmpR family regulator
VKVLVVEDDGDLRDLTSYALRRDGYEVIVAADGQQGLRLWESQQPDIVLLDVNLPRLNGFEVCRRIRTSSRTPILMVTGCDEEEDVLRGLNLGADDYVTKPFSAKQLLARMRAVMRRASPEPYSMPAGTVEAGDLMLNLRSYEATRGGTVVQLTPREFRVLYMLVLNEGQVIPYASLINYVWGYDGGDSNLLKTHISHLRTKLNLPLDGEGGIKAILGVGYKFVRPQPLPAVPPEAAAAPAPGVLNVPPVLDVPPALAAPALASS